jgi:hypothetical protein
MLRKCVELGLLIGALWSTAPALAAHDPVTLIDANCISVTDSAGCLFLGNADAHTTPYIQAAYNAVRTPGISLGFVLETGGLQTGPNWSITFDDPGMLSGTWTLLNGTSADFLGVKANGGFTLFSLANDSTSGTWSTAGIPDGNHALSHLTFWNDGGLDPNGGVPEPSSWLMLIAGFGLTGAIARRRARDMQRVSA